MSDSKPFSGLKVVDLAWVVAGPMIGRVLADCGAEVVRIESSRRIETARMMGPFPGGELDPQRSALFENCNAGKLGLALDMSRAEGRQIVLDLAHWGDVLIESFAPGQMQRWGLGYETLARHNPRLVMVSTSLMGQTGPLSAMAGYGNLGAALSGFQTLVGHPDGEMVGPFGPYTDYVAPRFATAALLAAIDDGRRSGKGVWLDISQVEAGLQFLGPEFAEFCTGGAVAGAHGNRVPDMAPHGVFRAKGEDRWVAVAVRSDEEWRRLAGRMGADATDERFSTLRGRKLHEDDLEAMVGGWTGGIDVETIETLLQSDDIPAHVVADSRDISADRQLRHRGHFMRLPHDLGGDSVVEACRFRLSDTPVDPVRAAPTFGRDADYVLGTILSYSSKRIEALRSADILA